MDNYCPVSCKYQFRDNKYYFFCTIDEVPALIKSELDEGKRKGEALDAYVSLVLRLGHLTLVICRKCKKKIIFCRGGLVASWSVFESATRRGNTGAVFLCKKMM